MTFFLLNCAQYLYPRWVGHMCPIPVHKIGSAQMCENIYWDHKENLVCLGCMHTKSL